MLKTTNLTNTENLSLAKEIVHISPISTPFTTLLLANKRYENATGKIHTWREKSLSLNDLDGATSAEGAEMPTPVASTRAEYNNTCEIISRSVSVSGSAQATTGTGTNDLFASEILDRTAELKVALNQRLISGIKDDGSVSGIRKMAGLLSFVHADNKITGATAGVVTEAEVKMLARKLWEQGVSSADIYVLVNADLKEQLDQLYVSNYNYISKTTEFGLIVNTINTNYSNLHFVLDRHMSPSKMVAFDLNAVSIAYLRQPFFEALAKTGDALKGQVLVESTLRVASTKAVAEYTLKA